MSTLLYHTQVWAFCVVDRLSVDTLVRQQWAELAPSLPSDFATRSPPPAAVAIPQHWKYEAVARVELGRFPVPFSGPDEWWVWAAATLLLPVLCTLAAQQGLRKPHYF